MRPVFLFSLLICISHTHGQNLIVNGTFEDINICTEYRVECAPEAWVSSHNGFANYFQEAKRAHSGVNCMAIEAGNFKKPYQRTLLRSRLLCGLRKGATYQLEFYIKSFHFVLDSIGVILSANDPLFDKTPIHKMKASLYLEPVTRPMDISDSLWHKIVINYTATGEERFFTFGYFARNDYVGERSHPLENKYFVYLDDIYMTPLDPNERLCEGWQKIRDEIYRENERHTLLEKKISHYKRNPPAPPVITKTIVTRIDTLVLPDILFATGKSDLQPSSHSLLDSFSRAIGDRRIDSIVVEGHTDSSGSFFLNEKLSLERAEAVASYLREKMTGAHILARGWAFSRPIAGNSTPEGRQKNRRVEVFLYVRD